MRTPAVHEITEAEYWRRHTGSPARPGAALCEACQHNAEELRVVGPDHRNYAPGWCPECDITWPAP
jgi:hypothetical protein